MQPQESATPADSRVRTSTDFRTGGECRDLLAAEAKTRAAGDKRAVRDRPREPCWPPY